MITGLQNAWRSVAGIAVVIGMLSSSSAADGAALIGNPDADLRDTQFLFSGSDSGHLPARHRTLATSAFTAEIGVQPSWAVGDDGRTFSIAWANVVDTRITATLKSGSYDNGGGLGHYVALYPDQLVQRITVTFGSGRSLDQPLDSTGASPIDIPAGERSIQKIDLAYDGGNGDLIHFVWNFNLPPPLKKDHIAIEIAPMSKPAADGTSNGALPAGSAFTEVDGGGAPPIGGFNSFDDEFKFVDSNLADIQKSIFKRIGIAACSTEPEALKDKDGAQDFIEISEVLNDGGVRTSFGYFIKFNYPGGTIDPLPQTGIYFALFSYDKIKFKDPTKPPICAAEFFLFKYSDAAPAQNLKLGLAIGSGGQRLSAVPIELARVANFRPTHPKSEPVRPGVGPNKGCMVCHGLVGKTPQQTLPFPWLGAPTTGQ